MSQLLINKYCNPFDHRIAWLCYCYMEYPPIVMYSAMCNEYALPTLLLETNTSFGVRGWWGFTALGFYSRRLSLDIEAPFQGTRGVVKNCEHLSLKYLSAESFLFNWICWYFLAFGTVDSWLQDADPELPLMDPTTLLPLWGQLSRLTSWQRMMQYQIRYLLSIVPTFHVQYNKPR